MLVVQEKRVPLPMKLTSEGVQAIVGFLAEHHTCRLKSFMGLLHLNKRIWKKAVLFENIYLPSKVLRASSEG